MTAQSTRFLDDLPQLVDATVPIGLARRSVQLRRLAHVLADLIRPALNELVDVILGERPSQELIDSLLVVRQRALDVLEQRITRRRPLVAVRRIRVAAARSGRGPRRIDANVGGLVEALVEIPRHQPQPAALHFFVPVIVVIAVRARIIALQPFLPAQKTRHAIVVDGDAIGGEIAHDVIAIVKALGRRGGVEHGRAKVQHVLHVGLRFVGLERLDVNRSVVVQRPHFFVHVALAALTKARARKHAVDLLDRDEQALELAVDLHACTARGAATSISRYMR
jgi:hypothetical protein